MDEPTRYLAMSAVSGAAKGIAITAAIVLFNIGGLRGLLLASGEPVALFSVIAIGIASLTALAAVVLAIRSLSRSSGY